MKTKIKQLITITRNIIWLNKIVISQLSYTLPRLNSNRYTLSRLHHRLFLPPLRADESPKASSRPKF